MAWSPKAADSREAGYIYANRSVSEAYLRLQKRSGPYISRGDVLQHQLVQAQIRHQPLPLGVLLLQTGVPTDRSLSVEGSSFSRFAWSTCRPPQHANSVVLGHPLDSKIAIGLAKRLSTLRLYLLLRWPLQR